MGEAIVYKCDTCGNHDASDWSGEPHGWVRFEGKAGWDGFNYHIMGDNDKGKKSFCSIKCFVKYLKLPSM